MKMTPTTLFVFLMVILFFLVVSIGIIGPMGMSANNTYIVALAMTYVFIIVPVVAIKMIAIAWKDAKEFILRKGVN